MKQLLIIVISLIAASSCKADFSIIDTLKNKDKTLARILDYEVEDNERLRIRFDTSVLLADYRFNGKRIEAYGYGNEILINLPYTLSYGEEATVSITVKKDTGNYTRASLRIEGHNENLPRMLINELSTDGTMLHQTESSFMQSLAETQQVSPSQQEVEMKQYHFHQS